MCVVVENSRIGVVAISVVAMRKHRQRERPFAFRPQQPERNTNVGFGFDVPFLQRVFFLVLEFVIEFDGWFMIRGMLGNVLQANQFPQIALSLLG